MYHGPEIFSPYMKVGHPTLTTRGIASLSMEYQARHECSASVWCNLQVLPNKGSSQNSSPKVNIGQHRKN